MRSPRAFTLIELLIVVAIIAILAAIAVPNFLEAQTRAKVSRVKADLRSLATAIEAYGVDYNAYPPDVPNPQYRLSDVRYLSTPIAYITSVNLRDPFNTTGMFGSNNLESFQYFNFQNSWGPNAMVDAQFQTRTAALKSWGPDRNDGGLEWLILGLDYTVMDPSMFTGINRQ